METKYIIWLTLLVLQASCEQKKSLTFVIDGTRSMGDDINHVREAAKSIMDIVRNGNSSNIEDIVLVVFRDPGNYDCPEMCLSGIKLGLEESMPGSFLFVFTDASAKDYEQLETIKTLSQEKQIQIVFVLTGDCGDLGSPASQVYYNIAAASNGQVFVASKDNVGKVLNYVKETIKGDRTVILSSVVPGNINTDTYVDFNIDDQTEYALVSATGANVELKVFKDGVELPGEKVTWIENVKILKLVGITPGLYKAALRGSSTVNVMVLGRTDFNFKFGFSDSPQNSLKDTQTQPIAGEETHLIISVKYDGHSADIENVKILDMNDRVIGHYPLTNVGSNVYRTDKFLAPNAMFKVVVTAISRNTGSPVSRIADTPVKAMAPV